MPAPLCPPTRFSRRALMGVGVGAAAVVPLTAAGRAGLAGAAPRSAALAAIQSGGGDPAAWRTWLLTSADELRPAAPAAPTQAEIDEVTAAQAAPTEAVTAAMFDQPQ
ncbi:MAG TPA: hypothetical protein VKA61_12480 [Sphingomicrobium sp.]|nr:hypothetical protein [Sphingomicrobium sp.]